LRFGINASSCLVPARATVSCNDALDRACEALVTSAAD
jgi:hypothetical protein